MSDIISRDETLKVLRGKAIAKYPNSFFYGLFAAANEILDIPAVDAVEVVRCKDCKHYEIHKPKVLENCERGGRLIPMKPDDFCSYGERRAK